MTLAHTHTPLLSLLPFSLPDTRLVPSLPDRSGRYNLNSIVFARLLASALAHRLGGELGEHDDRLLPPLPGPCPLATCPGLLCFLALAGDFRVSNRTVSHYHYPFHPASHPPPPLLLASPALPPLALSHLDTAVRAHICVRYPLLSTYTRTPFVVPSLAPHATTTPPPPRSWTECNGYSRILSSFPHPLPVPPIIPAYIPPSHPHLPSSPPPPNFLPPRPRLD